jgi:SPP1 gp7 family putative phage head morphogenesis protein
MNILGMKLPSFRRAQNKPEQTAVTSPAAAAASRPNSRERISPADKRIIDAIVKQYADRSRKDIQKWRTAIKMAEHPEKPRMNQLHDLYNDLKTDGHYKSLIRLRKYASLNTAFTITDGDGEVNEEATSFFNKAWFYKFISNAMDSIFYGTTLVELLMVKDKKADFKVIPRRNVIPQLKAVLPDVTKDDYINYADPYYENWLIEVTDEETELGLMNDIVPNLIWKRNVAQSWAEFCEKFGMPLITATTNSNDPKTIDRVNDMLFQLGEASLAVFPQGTTIEFKESNRTDAFRVYSEFIKTCKSEIATAIVGGDMIIENGSSRSQSEVHERNLDDKIAVADKRFIKFLVDDQLIPLLIRQGVNVLKEGDVLEFDQSHNLELDKFWDIVSGMLDKGYEPDMDWLAKTFSVPLVGKKKTFEPTAYQPIMSSLNLPEYPQACCSGHIQAAGSLARKRLQEFQDKLLQELWDNKDTLSSEAQLTITEGLELVKGLHNGWGRRRTEAAWNAPDHLALSMMEYNLFEFAESKTEARLATFSELLINKDKAQIRSFEEFKREASRITENFNGTWLETEYNLSVATGQTSAAYLRAMADKDTVTSFVQYQTAGDSKVRPEHAALNGKIFSLDDKEAMKLWPPNSYNCRCEMVQYTGRTEGKVTSGNAARKLLGEKFEGSKFDLNRGDLKAVFTKAQQYADANGKKIEKMDFEVYNLEPFSKMKGLEKARLDSSITPDNVKELFKENAGVNLMGFEDYLNRKMVMTKKSFNTHTKGKYVTESENRHQLFALVKDVLLSPDEVWLKPKQKQTFYLRYYDGFAMAVPVNITNIRTEIGTWFKVKADEKEIRSGLLIHKKKP